MSVHSHISNKTHKPTREAHKRLFDIFTTSAIMDTTFNYHRMTMAHIGTEDGPCWLNSAVISQCCGPSSVRGHTAGDGP